jgi:hypothetical protein
MWRAMRAVSNVGFVCAASGTATIASALAASKWIFVTCNFSLLESALSNVRTTRAAKGFIALHRRSGRGGVKEVQPIG